jgi:hypothetical protein
LTAASRDREDARDSSDTFNEQQMIGNDQDKEFAIMKENNKRKQNLKNENLLNRTRELLKLEEERKAGYTALISGLDRGGERMVIPPRI